MVPMMERADLPRNAYSFAARGFATPSWHWHLHFTCVFFLLLLPLFSRSPPSPPPSSQLGVDRSNDYHSLVLPSLDSTLKPLHPPRLLLTTDPPPSLPLRLPLLLHCFHSTSRRGSFHLPSPPSPPLPPSLPHSLVVGPFNSFFHLPLANKHPEQTTAYSSFRSPSTPSLTRLSLSTSRFCPSPCSIPGITLRLNGCEFPPIFRVSLLFTPSPAGSIVSRGGPVGTVVKDGRPDDGSHQRTQTLTNAHSSSSTYTLTLLFTIPASVYSVSSSMPP